MIDVLGLTRDLVGIESLNPPGNEEACARYLSQVLRDLGFEVHLHEFGSTRFNLIADLPGRGPGRPFGFTGHMDTVPLGMAEWKYDPYGGQVEGGRLYGRGTSDMKAGIAAFVAACAQCLADLRAGAGVQLLLTGGEETGCDGARAMVADSAGLLRPLRLLLVGEPTANYPCVGHKGALWLSGLATGKTAHGAMPEQGINAIYKAAHAVERLRSFDMNQEAHPLMGLPTLNVGTFHAGININSVPDRAEFTIDARTVPGMQHSCLCKQLQRFLTTEIDLNPILDVPALGTDSQDSVVREVSSICEAMLATPITERSVPYFTDGSTLLPATGNPPVIILGPGEPTMAHQTDEYCEVARLTEGVEVYRKVLLLHEEISPA